MGPEKISPEAQTGGEFCPHGNNPGSCELCHSPEEKAAAEKSGLAETIARLAGQSKFERSTLDTPNCEIQTGGKKYTIESVEDPEHADIGRAYELIVEAFGQEEVVSAEYLHQNIGKQAGQEIEQRLQVLKDDEGKIAATTAYNLMDAPGGKGTEAVIFVSYVVVAKNTRQSGLGREVYISALLDAAEQARAQGKKISYAIGECSHTSEKFWNKVGWKRIYSAEAAGDGKNYKEIEYICPPVDFDRQTGAMAAGTRLGPEHLMVDNFSPNPPDRTELVGIIESIFRDYQLEEEDFANPDAYNRHKKLIDELLDKAVSGLAGGGDFLCLSAAERQAGRERGLRIEDFAAADREDVNPGKEDF